MNILLKKSYSAPTIEAIEMPTADVITTSNMGKEDYLAN